VPQFPYFTVFVDRLSWKDYAGIKKNFKNIQF